MHKNCENTKINESKILDVYMYFQMLQANKKLKFTKFKFLEIQFFLL